MPSAFNHQQAQVETEMTVLLRENPDLRTDDRMTKSPNSLRKFFLRETGMTMSAWRNTRS